MSMVYDDKWWRAAAVVALVLAGCGADPVGRSSVVDVSLPRADAGGIEPVADRDDSADGAPGDTRPDNRAPAEAGIDAQPDAPPPAPTCTDGIRNGDETDVDCGGACARCGLGKRCVHLTDCASGACDGSGTCVECLTAASCPGADGECSLRTCDHGVCGVSLLPAHAVLGNQEPGDCQSRHCDGNGGVILEVDDSDTPDDQNTCTRDVCTNGAPSNPAVTSHAACGKGGFCDGQGHCASCTTVDDCDGMDSECLTRACVGGLCIISYSPVGKTLMAQVTGDCHVAQCTSRGNVYNAPLDSDVPDDGNPCTVERCSGGVASSAPADAGTPCPGGGICDGTGRCVQCLDASTCAGQDNACQRRTCSAAGACGLAKAAAAALVPDHAAGDCMRDQCDGNGAIVSVPDPNDLPADDYNPCTDEVCGPGNVPHPPSARGQACDVGKQCDGAGNCVSCLTAADCQGGGNACAMLACVRGACVTTPVVGGALVPAQTAGDCHTVQCDGAGGTQDPVDDTDLPVDHNPCTADVCALGARSNPALPRGTPCSDTQVCDGAGHCGCLTASDCGQDTPCQTYTCDESFVCQAHFVPDGMPVADPVAGDCLLAVCDGAGHIRPVPDPTDLPHDGNPCTDDVCSGGRPSNPAFDSGLPCAGGVCDGNGACVACLSDAQCPPSTACETHACGSDHACHATDLADGTALADPSPGDCLARRCDGAGNAINVPDPTDVPVDDGNDCTNETCQGSLGPHPPKDPRTPCAGGLCDGHGACVQCLAAADCAAGSICQPAVCGDDHACGVTTAPNGTPCGPNRACSQGVCACAGVFCDDFEDGAADGWTPVEQTASRPATWQVVSDTNVDSVVTLALRETSGNTDDNHYDIANGAGLSWQDQTVSALVKAGNDLTDAKHKAGVCARIATTDGTNAGLSGYCLFLWSDGASATGRLQIVRKVAGGSATIVGSLCTNASTFATNTWYRVALKVSGSSPVRLSASINNGPDVCIQSDTTATPPASGGAGLVAHGVQASFDDLLVTVP
jgi:hypothetical protein